MSDERDLVAPHRCPECDFLIIDEQPLTGPFGFYHAACLAAVTQ